MLDRGAPRRRRRAFHRRCRRRRRRRFHSRCRAAAAAGLRIHLGSHGFDEGIGALGGADAIPIVGRRIAAGEARDELPVLDAAQAARIRRVEPGAHDAVPAAGVGGAELLQDDGLADGGALLRVLRDPRAAPRVRLAPRHRVHVEGAVVDAGEPQVRHPVDALAALVGVGRAVALRGREPAFVAHGHHVRGVEALDVARHLGDPRGEHRGAACGGLATVVVARAARLVAELPGEHGWGVLVAVHEEGDVFLVGVYDLRVAEEGVVRGAAAKDLLNVEAY